MRKNRGMALIHEKNDHIYALTSIRGIAALWVVLYHCSGVIFSLLPEFSVLNPLIDCGHLAVPLFFILSGYVLSLRYLSRNAILSFKSIIQFLWFRLGRIYPVHIATLLICLVMTARRGWPIDEGHSVEKFLLNCFLIHAWDYSFNLSWNYPSWSISSEWFAYLCFPLLAVGLSRLRRTSLVVLLVITCVFSVWVYVIEQSLIFKGLVVVIPTFTGGVILGMVCQPCKPTASSQWLDKGFLILLIVLPFLLESIQLRTAIYILLFFLIVATLGKSGNRSSLFWQAPGLLYLGEISYSLYMTHTITLTLISRFLPLNAVSGSLLIFRFTFVLNCILLILLSALPIYYLVEKPLRKLSRQKLKLS
jgi:peptidoglycan/LPS O-acetylase OafA/YrhL